MGWAGRKPTDVPLGNNVWSQFQVTEGQEELADVADIGVGAVCRGHGAGQTVSTIARRLSATHQPQNSKTIFSRGVTSTWTVILGRTSSISLTWNLLEM